MTVPGDANARVGRQPSTVVSSLANVTIDSPVKRSRRQDFDPISVASIDGVPLRGNSIAA